MKDADLLWFFINLIGGGIFGLGYYTTTNLWGWPFKKQAMWVVPFLFIMAVAFAGLRYLVEAIT